MEDKYFFKTKEDITRYGISPIEIPNNDPQCIPITEEEYNDAMKKLDEKFQEEIDNEIKTDNDMRSYIRQLEAENAELVEANSMLEAENAALLFQNLTGEDFIL